MEKMNPKLSVIIPVYNTEKYLRQCLDSVVNQTLRDIEIICVDDGSTDSSPAILQEYAEKDERFTILRQKNLYAGVARNTGMEYAKGEYLLFLDSDDFFEPDICEASYSQAKKFDADICVFKANEFNQLTGTYREMPWTCRIDLMSKEEVFSATSHPDLYRFTTSAPWNKIFRREFVVQEQLQFQPVIHANDVGFILLAISSAKKIISLDKTLTHYRVNQGSSLQQLKDKNPEAFYEALTFLKNGLVSKNIYQTVEKSFVNYAMEVCRYNLFSLRTRIAFEHIYNLCKEEIFDELDINSRDKNFFSIYGKHLFDIRNDINTLPVEQFAEKYELFRPNKLHYIRGDAPVVATENHAYDNLPKVSVVIPVYNTASYLRECLDSIINQTLRDIEIICVNDGSTDESPAILEEYAEKDIRIKLVCQENGGLSAARNRGQSAARGKYIYFMDSDDILETDALEFLYSEADKNNLDVLFFDAVSFFENDRLEKIHSDKKTYYIRPHEYNDVYDGEELFYLFKKDRAYRASVCLQFMRREYLEDISLIFHEGIIYEDNLFSMQCILHAKRVSHRKKEFFKRRVREGSTTTVDVTYKNFYGYFICFRQLCFLLFDIHSFSAYEAEIYSEINLLGKKALEYYKLLDGDERKKEGGLSRLEKEFLNKMIFNCAISENNAIRMERDRLRYDLDCVHRSVSFRVGRIITCLPRKVCGGIRCLKENGMAYTWKRFWQKVAVKFTGRK